MVLDVGLRCAGTPAEDLLDVEVAEAEDLLEPLTLDRCLGGREQGAAAPSSGNRY
ncbi:MAG TPA: hypothetical protein VHF27_03470 [Acidimicrobiales bacterium]|nr:hypothetical protein [Acidimicrobiales bacterium]